MGVASLSFLVLINLLCVAIMFFFSFISLTRLHPSHIEARSTMFLIGGWGGYTA